MSQAFKPNTGKGTDCISICTECPDSRNSQKSRVIQTERILLAQSVRRLRHRWFRNPASSRPASYLYKGNKQGHSTYSDIEAKRSWTKIYHLESPQTKTLSNRSEDSRLYLHRKRANLFTQRRTDPKISSKMDGKSRSSLRREKNALNGCWINGRIKPGYCLLMKKAHWFSSITLGVLGARKLLTCPPNRLPAVNANFWQPMMFIAGRSAFDSIKENLQKRSSDF